MQADPKDNKIVFLNRLNKYLFDKNSISMSLVKARIKKIIKKINVNIIHGNEIYFHNLKFCIIALRLNFLRLFLVYFLEHLP